MTGDRDFSLPANPCYGSVIINIITIIQIYNINKMQKYGLHDIWPVDMETASRVAKQSAYQCCRQLHTNTSYWV